MNHNCLHSWKRRFVALVWGGDTECIRYRVCALCGTVLL